MTLLDDIIRDATNQDVLVSTLLRKVKVLASRVDVSDLSAWVDKELAGYAHDDVSALPSYRGPLPANVLGEFMLPFHQTSSTLGIAPSAFPANLRDTGSFDITFGESVSSLETMVAANNSEMALPWPDDHIRMTNTLMANGKVGLYRNAWLIRAWRPITPGAIAAVLDGVRNRVLDMALELERLSPEIGERNFDAPTNAVQTIVNTTIYGNVQSLVQGSNNVTVNQVPAGDRTALLKALSSAGVTDEQLASLVAAIDADHASANTDLERFGPATRGWLSTIGGAAVSASSSGVGGIVTGLVLSFFGIG